MYKLGDNDTSPLCKLTPQIIRLGIRGTHVISLVEVLSSSRDEMNHFRYHITSSAPCLKGFANTKL
jgi:hypothetical protein